MSRQIEFHTFAHIFCDTYTHATCMYMCIRTYAHIHTHACTYVHTWKYEVYIYIYICTHTHMNTNYPGLKWGFRQAQGRPLTGRIPSGGMMCACMCKHDYVRVITNAPKSVFPIPSAYMYKDAYLYTSLLMYQEIYTNVYRNALCSSRFACLSV